MGKARIWQIRPVVYFYIHHQYLDTFIKPLTCIPEWTIMILESGSFFYSFNGMQKTVTGLKMLFCPPDAILQRKVVAPATFHYMRVNWVYPDGTSANGDPSIPAGEISVTDTSRLSFNLHIMKYLSAKNDAFSLKWLNDVFNDTWMLYCADICESNIPHFKESDDELMNESLDNINEYVYKNIKINEVAISAGLSQVQFTRRFKNAFNITPQEYITLLKMQRARRLLIETDFNMRKIAECCGYQNEYYLSTVFAKKNGISPTEFRKKYRL